jgi:SAM-dependent methyltransferase
MLEEKVNELGKSGNTKFKISEGNMFEIRLELRICECCGGSDLEQVWSSESVVRRSVNTWRFPVRVAICRTCGFCFASPGPKSDDLARYHADGMCGYKGIGLAYSIENRQSVLKRYRAPAGVFAEVGGNQALEFHRRCAELFGKQINVEVSEDTPAEYRSVKELPENSVDVLAHYDVLEHVPQVRDFLADCHRALKPNGVMVCEVPDIRLYPRNLLLLEFEHVNHFSVTTLNAIAQSVGLQLIEVGHVCSRPYGFLSVFRKTFVRKDQRVDLPFEYLDALACIQGGIEQIRRNSAQLQSLRKRVTESGNHKKKVTLWAVTELLRRLLENYKLPETAMVVDSDPRRRTHLEREGITVFQPQDCREHIKHSELLVIFAPRYKMEILEWVTRETGKSFGMDELVIAGSSPLGETLT